MGYDVCKESVVFEARGFIASWNPVNTRLEEMWLV